MRPTGRSPPFLLIGLTVALFIVGFNYWNVSSRNNVLSIEVTSLREHVRSVTAIRLTAEKRSEDAVIRIRDCEESKEKITNMISDYKVSINNLEKELNGKKSEIESAKSRSSTCEANKLACDNDKFGITEENHKLKDELKEFKSKNSAAQPNCESACKDQVGNIVNILTNTIGKEPIRSALTQNGVDVESISALTGGINLGQSKPQSQSADQPETRQNQGQMTVDQNQPHGISQKNLDQNQLKNPGETQQQNIVQNQQQGVDVNQQQNQNLDLNLQQNLVQNQQQNLVQNEQQNLGQNQQHNLGQNQQQNLDQNQQQKPDSNQQQNAALNQQQNAGLNQQQNAGLNQQQNAGLNQQQNEGLNQLQNIGQNELQNPNKQNVDVNPQNPGINLEQNPGLKLEQNPGLKLEQNPGLKLEQNPGLKLEQNPGIKLEQNPGLKLEQNPGFNAGIGQTVHTNKEQQNGSPIVQQKGSPQSQQKVTLLGENKETPQSDQIPQAQNSRPENPLPAATGSQAASKVPGVPIVKDNVKNSPNTTGIVPSGSSQHLATSSIKEAPKSKAATNFETPNNNEDVPQKEGENKDIDETSNNKLEEKEADRRMKQDSLGGGRLGGGRLGGGRLGGSLGDSSNINKLDLDRDSLPPHSKLLNPLQLAQLSDPKKHLNLPNIPAPNQPNEQANNNQVMIEKMDKGKDNFDIDKSIEMLGRKPIHQMEEEGALDEALERQRNSQQKANQNLDDQRSKDYNYGGDGADDDDYKLEDKQHDLKFKPLHKEDSIDLLKHNIDDGEPQH